MKTVSSTKRQERQNLGHLTWVMAFRYTNGRHGAIR